MEFLSLWQSKREIANMRKNILRTLMLNANNAKFNGGVPPLGYDIDEDKNYVINEEEAFVVKTIFQDFAKGKGYILIADELNKMGFKTKAGNSFGKNSIRELLKNKKYIGIYEYNKTPSRDKNGQRNSHAKKQEQEIITVENAIPVIIDPKLFEEVQNKMNSHVKRYNTAIEPYLLSGILKCENCGASYSGDTRTKNGTPYFYYYCNGKKNKKNHCDSVSIPREKIETLVLDYLKSLNTPEVVESINQWFANNKQIKIDDRSEQLKGLKNQLAKKEKEVNKIIDMMLEKNSPALSQRLDEAESNIAYLKEKIEEMQLEQSKFKGVTAFDVTEKLSALNRLKEKSRSRQKDIIQIFIREITVRFEENAIYIKITSRLDRLLGVEGGNFNFGAEGGT